MHSHSGTAPFTLNRQPRKQSLGEVATRGIWKENPVFVHLMGLCPALAVTNSVINGLAMALATAFVLVGSSIFISLLRHAIPHAVRISTYVLIVATFVTVADLFMQVTLPAVSQSLGAFIYLIVVNCMILGRHEAFSSKNNVGRSVLDALGTSLGFLIALVLMGGVRELLGAGALSGRQVLPASFEPWIVMGLPPGGFFTIAFILLGLNAWALRRTGIRGPALRQRVHGARRVAGRVE
ncbi:MAG: electron transport complex subunit RsxE [Gemmatimonadota bacterium]